MGTIQNSTTKMPRGGLKKNWVPNHLFVTYSRLSFKRGFWLPTNFLNHGNHWRIVHIVLGFLQSRASPVPVVLQEDAQRGRRPGFRSSMAAMMYCETAPPDQLLTQIRIIMFYPKSSAGQEGGGLRYISTPLRATFCFFPALGSLMLICSKGKTVCKISGVSSQGLGISWPNKISTFNVFAV